MRDIQWQCSDNRMLQTRQYMDVFMGEWGDKEMKTSKPQGHVTKGSLEFAEDKMHHITNSEIPGTLPLAEVSAFDKLAKMELLL